MPSSDWHAIPAIIDLVMQADPRSILDIGVGFGKYGMLCREYMDVWQRRYWPADWQVVIDGIEPYSRYIGPLQEAIYNTIHDGTVADTLPTLGHYDLILFIDVLEHLEREAGVEVLGLIAEHSTRAIVTTPVQIAPQGAVFGNEYECHVTQWTKLDLLQHGRVLTFGNIHLLQLTEETPCKNP